MRSSSKSSTIRNSHSVSTSGRVQAEQRIVDQIRALAAGEITSYGEIARRAGLPGRARMVARVLAANSDAELPWHRVVRSDRRIAFALDHPMHAEQARRLTAEGHALAKDGQIVGNRLRFASAADGQQLDRLLFARWAPATSD